MRIKLFLILIAVCGLNACTLLPGQHMPQFSSESSVDFPVNENNKVILKKLHIKPITAQLIVDLERDINNKSLGFKNAANLFFHKRIGSKAIQGVPPQQEYNQYHVGPRDILTITVWGHPELTIPAGEFRSAEAAGTVVGEDGTFFYPFAGVIKAVGKTVEEIRAELTKLLSVYIEQVQLDVRVNSYRSQRIYVVGEVKKPGIMPVKDIPLTVLEAINESGGLSPDADARNITLTRNDKVYVVNLLSLYEGGDLSQNVLLQHGDVLNVPDKEFNKVFVLGETNVVNSFAQGTNSTQRSRSVYMNKSRLSLTEALSDSGGINQETADAARIFVFRGGITTGKPEIFMLDAKAPDSLILADSFPLQPRDVVFVDRAEGIRWNQIIAQIQPTVTLLNSFVQPWNPNPGR